MAKIKVTQYSNSKEILKYDHFVSEKVILTQANSTTVGTRKIVKAGTIIPSNNATAKGVVLYDVDVTDGDESGALVIHGFIDKSKLPAQPDSAAIAALKQITFI
ncbi:hypothetical protein WS9_013385 [Paraclostridium sordellii 8483]|uniref:hypothetical protein n=1 Tax=Paraclostridium sordellii TaxID=1505 RepID=UPI0002F09FCC|nr:hypothetical protein [Paeniclostridium sordellii]TAN64781.1 hypothetical protein WS9_013385 [Paeniclostridium sordellii 8483]